MLSERTLAPAQFDRRKNPDGGYAPLLEPMARPVLRRCLEHGIPIVSNFGAANYFGVPPVVAEAANLSGVPPLRSRKRLHWDK
jgi:hypothetical protein